MLTSFLIFLKRFFLLFLGFLLILICLPYLYTEIYDFKETKPFEGKFWINPYQDLESGFIKANFHMHSHAWGGLTYGENTPLEMQKFYVDNNYTIAPITNYMQISRNLFKSLIYIPAYEHGLNIGKVHQIPIGSEKVLYWDYWLWQNVSHKQKMIKKLREKGSSVCLNHPEMKNSYTCSDLQKLSGYHFVEVLNHFAESPAEYDSALVSGKLSYLLANDDSHQAQFETTAKIYNQIYCTKNDAKAQLAALQAGKHVGIRSLIKSIDFKIDQLKLQNNQLNYDFKGQIDSVRVIADGKVWIQNLGSKATFDISKVKHYLRFEIYGQGYKAFTNPINRSSRPTAEVCADYFPETNWLKTILFRLCFLPLILIFWAIIKLF